MLDGFLVDDLLAMAPDLPVGGRVWEFSHFWRDLPLDRLVRGILEVGYKIPFTNLPVFRVVLQTPLVGKYADVLLVEVSTVLPKDAVETVPEKEREMVTILLTFSSKKTGI